MALLEGIKEMRENMVKGFQEWNSQVRGDRKLVERRLLSNLYMKQQIKVRIGEEMSEGSEIGREEQQGCPLSPTLFNIYLEKLPLMKNCILNTGGVNIGGRRIKCIRFADNFALLAEDERMVKNMLMEVNDR